MKCYEHIFLLFYSKEADANCYLPAIKVLANITLPYLLTNSLYRSRDEGTIGTRKNNFLGPFKFFTVFKILITFKKLFYFHFQPYTHYYAWSMDLYKL